jgi:galactokinase
MSDSDPVRRYAVPGRVNLMGDHTDYNDGFVLPMAIDRACVVEVRETTTEGVVRAESEQMAGDVTVAADGSDDPRAVEPPWGRFVAGAVRVLADTGSHARGAHLHVSSSVPLGSGLSSSSALSVALVLALGDGLERRVDGAEIARLALATEVAATGVPGGLMDQLTALYGRAGCALLIDIRGLRIDPVRVNDDVAVLVVHCGLPRTLAGSEYATRRAECEAIAARLGIVALRDATLDQVAHEPRARHVVTENARVHETARALARGDLGELGALLLASHASLRDDYEVSTLELDTLVEVLVRSGAAGARLTGAGFGGCVVAVTEPTISETVLEDAMRAYGDATGLSPLGFVARAVDGALTHMR